MESLLIIISFIGPFGNPYIKLDVKVETLCFTLKVHTISFNFASCTHNKYIYHMHIQINNLKLNAYHKIMTFKIQVNH